jgi:hypothetical protein
MYTTDEGDFDMLDEAENSGYEDPEETIEELLEKVWDHEQNSDIKEKPVSTEKN